MNRSSNENSRACRFLGGNDPRQNSSEMTVNNREGGVFLFCHHHNHNNKIHQRDDDKKFWHFIHNHGVRRIFLHKKYNAGYDKNVEQSDANSCNDADGRVFDWTAEAVVEWGENAGWWLIVKWSYAVVSFVGSNEDFGE